MRFPDAVREAETPLGHERRRGSKWEAFAVAVFRHIAKREVHSARGSSLSPSSQTVSEHSLGLQYEANGCDWWRPSPDYQSQSELSEPQRSLFSFTECNVVGANQGPSCLTAKITHPQTYYKHITTTSVATASTYYSMHSIRHAKSNT